MLAVIPHLAKDLLIWTDTGTDAHDFVLQELIYPLVPIHEQTQLFYTSSTPIKIVHIRAGPNVSKAVNTT